MHGIPWLSESLGPERLDELRRRIRTDPVRRRHRNGMWVLELTSIEPGDYVRAVQEAEMLKTRVLGAAFSFAEAWRAKPALRACIASSDDPQEAKWSLGPRFGYRLATNFMPMYARSLYEHFGARSVLDPCAGWGDRMAGALAAGVRYTGFDPNRNLLPGYRRIQRDFGARVLREDSTTLAFDSGHSVHAVRFEDGEALLGGATFDFALTSPPFFDLEDYGEYMPVYADWIEEFYRPLFAITYRHLRPGGVFAVHVNDTRAGRIEGFLRTVGGFVPHGTMAYTTGCSKKLRRIHLFLKPREAI